ncbi:hypothetical protein EXE59_06370 [Nocardioides eburneiflavus]|uniref:Septum formation-related domain-containing protein n=1 Tax=Nocardioides eburneiflavus TaxID=2518372 RepID=A0A4Z1CJ52_9ACTN|nr:septum formation family protein [Nocardioides eburneiflavus]TGN63613.1 hypothetical protein EXE59_06370 [Nocardioides eburneiflavus]
MTRCLGLSAAVAALVAATLTTVTAPVSAADPGVGAPAVGQCFDMDVEELAAASYVEAPVDCAGTHTARTIAVAILPDDLTYASTGKLTRFALETCFPAQRKVLRTSLLGMRMSAYNVGWFLPTPEQQAAGARWLRCDLVLGGASLEPLPAKVALGKLPYEKSVSRCLTGGDFLLTTCTSRHAFRATAAIKVKASRYPSEKAWKRIGTQRCRNAVTSRSYRFGWPSKPAWKADDRALICYSKSRR